MKSKIQLPITEAESKENDSVWELVINFTKIEHGGVNINDVLKYFDICTKSCHKSAEVLQ